MGTSTKVLSQEELIQYVNRAHDERLKAEREAAFKRYQHLEWMRRAFPGVSEKQLIAAMKDVSLYETILRASKAGAKFNV